MTSSGGFRWTVQLDPGALSARAEAAAALAVRAAAEAMRLRADALAPRRSGAMVASGGVEIDRTRARVRYTAPYARVQHDNAGLRHPGGGRARFLAEAAEAPETAQAMVGTFEDAMR